MKYKKGKKIGKWTLKEFLGSGGNGEVWKCSNTKGDFGAIKLLKYKSKKSYQRFLDEIKVMEENTDIPGIIPIIDTFLPKFKKMNIAYFVMKIGYNAEKKLKRKSLEEKIDAFLDLCETIKLLHTRNIAHRDIKPPNLLFYNDRLSISDFGLVDYPNKNDYSSKNEEIGAKWTIAPEMRRNSSSADGLKADIYSLAKTLWILLTEKNKGFDGQYSAISNLRLSLIYKNKYTTPLDILLTKCTDNDPNLRLDINDFITELNKWKVLNQDFSKRNQEQWYEIQKKLFPSAFPKRVIWSDINDIIIILKVICTYKNLNHVFLPTGGGLDLLDSKLSVEQSCIELQFFSKHIVKPKRLLFESINYDPQWNYFRLELELLSRAVITKDCFGDSIREDVTQLSPGQYKDSNYYENSYYREQEDDEYVRPTEMEYVTRWLSGSFVIFSKSSTYNSISSTYDGRHNKMDTDKFRDYIQQLANVHKKHLEKNNKTST